MVQLTLLPHRNQRHQSEEYVGMTHHFHWPLKRYSYTYSHTYTLILILISSNIYILYLYTNKYIPNLKVELKFFFVYYISIFPYFTSFAISNLIISHLISKFYVPDALKVLEAIKETVNY